MPWNFRGTPKKFHSTVERQTKEKEERTKQRKKQRKKQESFPVENMKYIYSGSNAFKKNFLEVSKNNYLAQLIKVFKKLSYQERVSCVFAKAQTKT